MHCVQRSRPCALPAQFSVAVGVISPATNDGRNGDPQATGADRQQARLSQYGPESRTPSGPGPASDPLAELRLLPTADQCCGTGREDCSRAA